MKLLLDTHVWVWQLLDPDRLSRRASAALAEPTNELFLSPISTWEALVLARRGRLELRPDPFRWVGDALAASPTTMAELTHAVAMRSEDLPGFGSTDPADRFIVATALVHGFTVVTADKGIRRYRRVPTLY